MFDKLTQIRNHKGDFIGPTNKGINTNCCKEMDMFAENFCENDLT